MRTRRILAAMATVGGLFSAVAVVVAMNREYLPGIQWPEPPIVTPCEDGGPSSDAIVLFDGTDLSAWEPSDTWKVADGYFTEGHGDIKTKQSFGDIQLHIEWSSPNPPRGRDQDRGNSGIFFQNRYELQILDSYENETYFEGQAGSIYKQTPPMVNAMRPPGEWNTYDIVWTAPKFNDDGSLKSPAYITAFQNGVLILDHFEVMGETPWHTPPQYEAHGPGPLRLQDHGHPVRFRNIWVRELKPLEGKRVAEPMYHDHDSGKKWPVAWSASIEGTITFDAKPLQDAKLTLNSIKPSPDNFMDYIENGKFSFPHVKPGRYVVTARRKEGSALKQLPEKYSDEKTSVLLVEVNEGSNTMEFNLTP